MVRILVIVMKNHSNCLRILSFTFYVKCFQTRILLQHRFVSRRVEILTMQAKIIQSICFTLKKIKLKNKKKTELKSKWVPILSVTEIISLYSANEILQQ